MANTIVSELILFDSSLFFSWC